MQPMLSGFVDELVKIADVASDAAPHADHHHKGVPVTRNYMASVAIGAAAAPLLALIGKGITRMLHNKDIGHALKSVEGGAKRESLMNEIHTGPIFGRIRPDLPANQRPLVTPADLAGDVAKAALTGSIVQMIRDRFSGSAGVKNSR